MIEALAIYFSIGFAYVGFGIICIVRFPAGVDKTIDEVKLDMVIRPRMALLTWIFTAMLWLPLLIRQLRKAA